MVRRNTAPTLWRMRSCLRVSHSLAISSGDKLPVARRTISAFRRRSRSYSLVTLITSPALESF